MQTWSTHLTGPGGYSEKVRSCMDLQNILCMHVHSHTHKCTIHTYKLTHSHTNTHTHTRTHTYTYSLTLTHTHSLTDIATVPLSLKSHFQRTPSRETLVSGNDYFETTPTPCPSTPPPTIVARSAHTSTKRTATTNHLHRPGLL